MTLQRYDIATAHTASGASHGCLVAVFDGELLRYSDHLAALAEKDAALAVPVHEIRWAARFVRTWAKNSKQMTNCADTIDRYLAAVEGGR